MLARTSRAVEAPQSPRVPRDSLEVEFFSPCGRGGRNAAPHFRDGTPLADV
jgi:hypothetical protein